MWSLTDRRSLAMAVNVVLRVPSLILLEFWYRTNPEDIADDYFGDDSTDDMEAVVSFLYYSVLAVALSLLLLPMNKLINLYLYVLSGAILTMMHFAALRYVEEERSRITSDANQVPVYEDKASMQLIGMHLVIQVVFAALIAYLLPIKDWTRFLLLMYTLPMLSRAINLPVENLPVVHNFASIFMMLMCLMVVFNNIGMIIDMAKAAVNEANMLIQVMGWLQFFISMWSRLFLASQFLIFWIILLVGQLYALYVDGKYLNKEGLILYVLASVSECCVTPVSLIGLCVTVSYLAWFILVLTKLLLKGWDGLVLGREQTGWTEGFTMLLLGVQTDIMGLKSNQRVFLMSIVLFIVVLSLIQSMYELTDPVLLALSASHNKSVIKHVKAVVLSTFLWMFPLFMTYAICQFFELDYWLLVIISSCVLTSMQVLGSMAVYALFIYDSLLEKPWENLDDIVYWVKAVTRVLEFIVAVFVVLYGVKESIFGSWSWVNSSILVFHFYFNVWQRLQSGWKSFLLRREAVRKVESLPFATDDELRLHNDVCAICYQEMREAHVTPCRHIFHSICLRKWLYVKENCPICHQVIEFQPTAAKTTTNDDEDNDLLLRDNEDEWEDLNDFIHYDGDSDYSSSESHNSDIIRVNVRFIPEDNEPPSVDGAVAPSDGSGDPSGADSRKLKSDHENESQADDKESS
ncbi:RING finger protein 145-like [Tubulanus polymorphus]|uniref:RING finger protein 145-like n=1 Tax=Tubulanus polymorphus TaxID=672921 RepID=UPI003DA6AEC9